MKHISKEEFILFSGQLGLTVNERKIMEEHLLICEKCSKKLAQLRLRQEAMSGENKIDCYYSQKNLLSYIDNELDRATKLKVKSHLLECNRCLTIYKNMIDLPTWDIDSMHVLDIPHQTKKRIESTVFEVLHKKKTTQTVSETKEKIPQHIEKLIHEITLILLPLRPEVAFRGDDAKDLKVIEHPGGDLQITTDIENVEIQLTSIFEEFTIKAKTNKDGVAIFKNLKKGDYVSKVNGYQLDEIKVNK